MLWRQSKPARYRTERLTAHAAFRDHPSLLLGCPRTPSAGTRKNFSRRTGSVLGSCNSSVSDMCPSPLIANGRTLPDQMPLMGMSPKPRLHSSAFFATSTTRADGCAAGAAPAQAAVVLPADQQGRDANPKLLSHPPERGKTIGLGPVKYHLVSASSQRAFEWLSH